MHGLIPPPLLCQCGCVADGYELLPGELSQTGMANRAIPPPVMRVIYSRPPPGREVFHDVLKYGERTGDWVPMNRPKLIFSSPLPFNENYPTGPVYYLLCIRAPPPGPSRSAATLIPGAFSGIPRGMWSGLSFPFTHSNPTLEYYTMEFESGPAVPI